MSRLVSRIGIGLAFCFPLSDPVWLVEMPKPRVVDEGDVLVKVTGSTICGSDLHLYHGMYSVSEYVSPAFRGALTTVGSCRCHPSARER